MSRLGAGGVLLLLSVAACSGRRGEGAQCESGWECDVTLVCALEPSSQLATYCGDPLLFSPTCIRTCRAECSMDGGAQDAGQSCPPSRSCTVTVAIDSIGEHYDNVIFEPVDACLAQ